MKDRERKSKKNKCFAAFKAMKGKHKAMPLRCISNPDGIFKGSIVMLRNVNKCHQRSELKWKGCVLHYLRQYFKRSYCAFDEHSCRCH